MNKSCQLALVLAAFFCLSGRAAENAVSAGNRAFLYQREARVVLENHGWHVSHDENGELVADHRLGLMGAGNGGTQMLGLKGNPVPANAPFSAFAWLTLKFKPISVTRTNCAANIVSYTFWGNPSAEERKKVKPTPFNNPDSTKEIQEIMSRAEAALTAKRPEYASH